MPQTTPERAARWPGGEEQAIECLRAGGWQLGKDWVWHHPDNKNPTAQEMDASCYLIEEWDYGGLHVPFNPGPRLG